MSLTTIMAAFFPKSEKVISEKLSTTEHASFSADVQELNDRISAQTAANELVVADLAASAIQVTELTASLAAATALAEGRAAELTTITAERDTYKAHYDAAVKLGTKQGKEDEGSRSTAELASYNANAIAVFNQVHGK